MNFFKGELTLISLLIFMKFNDSYGDECLSALKAIKYDTKSGVEIYVDEFINIINEENNDTRNVKKINDEIKMKSKLMKCPDYPMLLFRNEFSDDAQLQKIDTEIHTECSSNDYATLYLCDLLVYIYDTKDESIKNVDQYCPKYPDCKKILMAEGFIFKYGVENFAYLVRSNIIRKQKKIKSQPENTTKSEDSQENTTESEDSRDVQYKRRKTQLENTEQSEDSHQNSADPEDSRATKRQKGKTQSENPEESDNSQVSTSSSSNHRPSKENIFEFQDTPEKLIKRFKGYLRRQYNRILEDFGFEDATTWCRIEKCGSELKKAGFEGRYRGSSNYSVIINKYGKNCDSLKEEDLPYKFCNFLVKDFDHYQQYGGGTRLYGTHQWCKQKGHD